MSHHSYVRLLSNTFQSIRMPPYTIVCVVYVIDNSNRYGLLITATADRTWNSKSNSLDNALRLQLCNCYNIRSTELNKWQKEDNAIGRDSKTVAIRIEITWLPNVGRFHVYRHLPVITSTNTLFTSFHFEESVFSACFTLIPFHFPCIWISNDILMPRSVVTLCEVDFMVIYSLASPSRFK